MSNPSEAGLALEQAIASEVRAIAAAQRITHRTIQDRAGMNERTFRRYFIETERRIPLEALASVAAALGVRVSEIVAAAERALSAPLERQEQEARELMGEEAWLNLQATREAHRSRQPQKRRKA